MKINIRNRKFALANKTGGMSGPAVHPIAVRMVYQVAQAVNLPIIGMGGVHTAEDAIEMILAGASEAEIRVRWADDVRRFRKLRGRYLLYE